MADRRCFSASNSTQWQQHHRYGAEDDAEMQAEMCERIKGRMQALKKACNQKRRQDCCGELQYARD